MSYLEPRAIAREARDRFRKRSWSNKFVKSSSPFSNTLRNEIGKKMVERGINKPFASFVYTTTNVGDEVQSIAQVGFIPKGQDVVAVNRDELSLYGGTDRIAIMNGWFSHRPHLWPPSRHINPIFYSFHIARDALARPEHAEYYRQHEPIGCRDQATVKKLNQIGVEAYFSGCCTLTIRNPYGPEERGDGVVIVDAHLGSEKAYPPSAPDLMRRLVPDEVSHGAMRLEQEVRPEFAGRYISKTERALELLSIYAKAKLVITSRLHCALPCLAMGTPVVMLHHNWESDDRFDGYRDIIPGYGPDDDAIDIDWSAPSATDVSEFRNRIIQGLGQKVREKVGLL